VYARQLDNQVLSFGVSGMLFRDGLVMYDRETDTLWTQVDGKAVKGSLSGRALEVVPSVHATWKQWKQLYPNSVVLKKRGIPRSRSVQQPALLRGLADAGRLLRAVPAAGFRHAVDGSRPLR
jgi:hypothetical protein